MTAPKHTSVKEATLYIDFSDVNDTTAPPTYALRKHTTMPDMKPQVSPRDAATLERHHSALESRKEATSLPEKLALLALNKSVPNIEKILLWACLVELVLQERISTYEIEYSPSSATNSQCKQKSYSPYVFNKKTTGDEVLDEVLQKVASVTSRRIPLSDILTDISVKVNQKLCAQLEKKGFLAITRSIKVLKYAKYELKNHDVETKIIEEVRSTLAANKEVSPSTYALLTLVLHSGLKKDILTQSETEKASGLSTGEQQELVATVICERLQHVRIEMAKKNL
jgi:hypothetical protein